MTTVGIARVAIVLVLTLRHGRLGGRALAAVKTIFAGGFMPERRNAHLQSKMALQA
ncbi:protein of unknown function [Shinella sp. WSC3-e]|nr:protein of unknown function [Shinella sp. WSC3-e]